MKLHFKLMLLALLAVPTYAQKGKTKVVPPTPKQLIEQYRFGEAINQLQSDIKEAQRRRKPTQEMEDLLAKAERLNVILEGTQQVIFVDSTVVNKTQMLSALHLGNESGRLTTYTRAFGKADSMGCTVYQSQLGNLTIFAQPTAGHPMLHASNLVGGTWSEPTPLQGLDNTDISQNYPFMLSDGVTLYFGAENPEGIGGYDIYFSRFDNEERVFRKPENAGMPFNSPANDYMLCIDEYNNLGYLVTDRRQPKDKVCIYTFIPPTVRTNLSDIGTNEAQLRAQASISSIAATQYNNKDVAEAKQRISALGVKTKGGNTQYDFTFVVNDSQVCHFPSDFTNPKARKLITQWQTSRKELDETLSQLETARETYSTASAERRTSLRQQILGWENAYEQGLTALHEMEKEIRNLENTKK